MADLQMAVERATNILRQYNVQEPPVDVQGIAENHGARVVFQELDDKISGLLVQQAGSTLIGVNALHHPNRQRFTIAHELAHLTLHTFTPTVYVDDLMIHFRGEGLSAVPPQEMEANTFAATLLMPEELIRKDLEGKTIDALDDVAVRSLALKYKVSQLALTIRLTQLGHLASSPLR